MTGELTGLESSKIKFMEFIQPDNIASPGFYRADGMVQRAVQQQGDLGYQQQVDNETILRFGGNCNNKSDSRLPYEQGARAMHVPFGGRMVELCKERERNLDTSGYVRNGSMVSAGFGDFDEFSKIRFGAMTRQSMSTPLETEVDRIHPLNRNYGVMGFFPFPEDTRGMNKKYTNQ
jgi:hypothetical protein